MGWKKKLVKITSNTFKVTVPEDYSESVRLTIVDAGGGLITNVIAGTEAVDIEAPGVSFLLLGPYLNPSLTVTVSNAVGKNLEIIVYG